MIVVFWLETYYSPGSRITESRVKQFQSDQLSDALKFAEDLRAKRRAELVNDEVRISHVCLQSEMSNSVGQAGVSDPNPDYDWYKRRINPQIKLGRDEGEDE